MARRRKTIPVAEVIDSINAMIAASPDDAREGRVALAILAERVLCHAGNYRGYNYLPSEFLPAEDQTSSTVLRDDFDDTRRRYF